MSDAFFQKLASGKYPFVLFKPPGLNVPVSAYLQDHQRPAPFHSFDDLPMSEVFILAPFHFSQKAPGLYIQKDEEMQWNETASLTALEITLPKVGEIPMIGEEDEFERYKIQFRKAKAALEQGFFQKVVLSRRMTLPGRNAVPAGSYFSHLIARYPNAFSYLAYLPEGGIWMGATPETLMKWENGQLATIALAGTLPAHTTIPWSSKEKEEHKFVTEYILTVLAKAGIENVQVQGPGTVMAGPVQHLKTSFSATIRDQKLLKGLLEALHPTPAVCGMPKQKAREFILKNEYDRSYYTGVTGIWNPGSAIDLYVNLRCMHIHSNGYCLFAGGGITAGSVLEKEWEETNWKLQVMKNVLSFENGY